MEYTELLNSLMRYGSAIMTVMAVLVFSTNIIVEVLKKVFSKLPTSYLTLAVAVILSVVALLAASAIFEIAVAWYCVAGAVVVGIFAAYAAMFGFDKFRDAWGKLQSYQKKQ